jgi:ankyrin repeat protein
VLLVGCGTTHQGIVQAPDISIHKAARVGHIEAVKQHLEAGSDVNAKDDKGRIPLHRAVGRGYKEIVELLLANVVLM